MTKLVAYHAHKLYKLEFFQTIIHDVREIINITEIELDTLILIYVDQLTVRVACIKHRNVQWTMPPQAANYYVMWDQIA